jgi:transcriptional regulator of acetoin/glycerol metabolism
MPSTTAQHQARIEAALAAGQAARSAVAASWARSVTLHRLDPGLRTVGDRLTGAEVAAARDRLGSLIDTAAPHLDRLFAVTSGLGACVVMADSAGVALERRGNRAEDRDFASAELWTGVCWSEAAAGTNGIGTCLAEGRAVTIHRDQHFLSRNIDLSCSSAPVHDAQGALAAVIDVSTARRDLPDGVAALLGHTVAEAARMIEADLFQSAFPKARLVLVPGTDRGLGALLAVDADDLVVGATRAARAHLDLPSDPVLRPQPLGDVLGLPSLDRLDDAERAVLARALARASGNVSAASRALGLSRATLHRKLGRRSADSPADLSQD